MTITGGRQQMNSVSAATRPRPTISEFNAEFFKYAEDGKFALAQCNDCSDWIYPHGPVCVRCFSSNISWNQLSGAGIVRSWTTFHKPYHPFFADKIPYTCAFVELDEGPRLITNVIGVAPTEVHCGMRVTATFENDGDLHLLQFKPVDD
jgi:uncharacterized OB-fold protein